MNFQRNVYYVPAVLLVLVLLCSGCMERQLTVKTEPADALVVLNDEEIGYSPVTINFEWYGDYNVRISKKGYQTLQTHRNLKRPIRDRFPFDLFVDALWPKRVVDKYEWTFQLVPYEAPERQDLIDSAVSLEKDALAELAQTKDGKKK
jgi:hypothetical protein